MRADLVNRALRPGRGDAAVGPNFRLMAGARIVEHGSRRDQPDLDQRAEGDAWLSPLATNGLDRGGFERRHGLEPGSRSFRVSLVALDADKSAGKALGHCRRGARAEEGIEG